MQRQFGGISASTGPRLSLGVKMQSGLPQFFPLIEGYCSHITFDDDAMKGVMNLLMDIDYSTREDVAVILTDRIRKAIGFVS